MIQSSPVRADPLKHSIFNDSRYLKLLQLHIMKLLVIDILEDTISSSIDNDKDNASSYHELQLIPDLEQTLEVTASLVRQRRIGGQFLALSTEYVQSRAIRVGIAHPQTVLEFLGLHLKR